MIVTGHKHGKEKDGQDKEKGRKRSPSPQETTPDGNANAIEGTGGFSWTPSEKKVRKWIKQFKGLVEPGADLLSGDQARNVFLMNPRNTQGWLQDLYTIWALADRDMDNSLSLSEFCVASFLIYAREKGQPIPTVLPRSVTDTVARVIKASEKKSAAKRPSSQPSTPLTLSTSNMTGGSATRDSGEKLPGSPHGPPPNNPLSNSGDRHVSIATSALSPSAVGGSGSLSVGSSPLLAGSIKGASVSSSKSTPTPKEGMSKKEIDAERKSKRASLRLSVKLTGGNLGDATELKSSYWLLNSRMILAYRNMFYQHRSFINGNYYLIPKVAPIFFSKSGLDTLTLGKIWNLSNYESNPNGLNDVAFVIAMHVVANTMKGKTLPLTTPEDVRLKIKEIMTTLPESQENNTNGHHEPVDTNVNNVNSKANNQPQFINAPPYKSLNGPFHISPPVSNPHKIHGHFRSKSVVEEPTNFPVSPKAHQPSPGLPGNASHGPSATGSPKPPHYNSMAEQNKLKYENIVQPQIRNSSTSPKKPINLVEPQVKPLSASGERQSSPALQPSPTLTPMSGTPPQQNTGQPVINNNGGAHTPLVSLARDSFASKRAGSFAFNQQEMDEFNFQPSTGHAGSDVIRDVARALIQQGNFSMPVVSASPQVPKPTIDVDIPMFTESQITRTREIGKGSFGKVWCGTVNGETVAIKDMVYKNEKEIEMWKKEVKILEKLQNADFLVQIKGYSISDKLLTIIMEMMECGSIYEIIHEKRNGPVHWSMLQKVRILRHVSKGIESLHVKNIVHRDLKSMNILIDGRGTAKLADLGCASIASTINTLDVGSPLWMAPEVHSGNYSYPCDIFSFGVVTYEVFNEALPDYDMQRRCVSINDGCVGYPIIRKCTHEESQLRPNSHGLVEMMDSLLLTFVTSVTRVIEMNHKGPQALPAQTEVERWYQILLNYEKEIFDTLLSTGLNLASGANMQSHTDVVNTTNNENRRNG